MQETVVRAGMTRWKREDGWRVVVIAQSGKTITQLTQRGGCPSPLVRSIYPALRLVLVSQHTMPYISTEALVGAGLLVVLAVGYQFMPTGSGSGSANSKKNKKNKKKTKSAATGNEQQVVSVPLPPAPVATSKAAANGLKQDISAKESTTAKPADKAESTVQPAQPAPAKPKTLAEKIAPQPRKSKVDE